MKTDNNEEIRYKPFDINEHLDSTGIKFSIIALNLTNKVHTL